MPHHSSFATPHHCLGIGRDATEHEIRSAYRTLALILHPDKAPFYARTEATARFQELNTAYRACLQLLTSPAQADYDWQYDSDNEDFEQHHPPAEEPMAGQAWWDHLTESDPVALWKWAKACKKAHRNSRRSMTDTERVILDKEYKDAYNEYETWRRKEEAVRQERDAQWRKEAELNEREYRNMMYFLQRKREAERDGRKDKTYLPDTEEEQCFLHWEDDDADRLRLPTDTWRDKLTNKSSTKRTQGLKGAVKELDNFIRQIQALEERNTWMTKNAGPVPVCNLFFEGNAAFEANDDFERLLDKKLKAIHIKDLKREDTSARLKRRADAEIWGDVKEDVGRKLAIAAKEARRNGNALDYRNVEGVRKASSRLFEEAHIRGEKKFLPSNVGSGKLATAEAVPDNWEEIID